MALCTSIIALAAFQATHARSQPESTTQEPSDLELCDCFEFDIMGAHCGVEQVVNNVCYTYRFKKVSEHSHCARSVDSVRLAIPARSSQLEICGLEESDLEGLVEETLPNNYGRRFDYDDDEKRFGLTFEFDDDDENRLFSGCFNARNDRVGSLQSGEIDISFDGGDRVARCEVSKRLPVFCAGTTAAPETTEAVEPVVPEGPTTVAPSSAPTYVACDTDDAFNIAFVMDESGSVSEDEWEVIKDFVARIATFDVAGPSYVSLFEYASLVKFEQFQDWTNLACCESDITDALDRNTYNIPGKTYTWDAVNRVLDEFYDYRKTCTDGCDTRHDLLFLVTDGAPSDTVCPDMIARANSTSVDIAIVAIGADADSWIDEVACLDIQDDGADIFYVESIEDSDDFNEIEGMIRAKTCNGENPAGLSDRGGEPWEYSPGVYDLGPVPTASGENDAPMDDA